MGSQESQTWRLKKWWSKTCNDLILKSSSNAEGKSRRSTVPYFVSNKQFQIFPFFFSFFFFLSFVLGLRFSVRMLTIPHAVAGGAPARQHLVFKL